VAYLEVSQQVRPNAATDAAEKIGLSSAARTNAANPTAMSGLAGSWTRSQVTTSVAKNSALTTTRPYMTERIGVAEYRGLEVGVNGETSQTLSARVSGTLVRATSPPECCSWLATPNGPSSRVGFGSLSPPRSGTTLGEASHRTLVHLGRERNGLDGARSVAREC